MVFSLGKLFFKLRADGRKYRGFWQHGKQHGEGEFSNNSEMTWRKGLWENGKRVRWLSETHTKEEQQENEDIGL
jgi:hypothetical protein